MSSDLIISLVLGVPFSIITGLYSGVILSRYIRFAELRNEVLRIIRTIDFMQEIDRVLISNDHDVSKLALIVSDLIYLKHHKAAEIASAIRTDIDEISIHVRAGRLNVAAFEQNYSNWQNMARSLPPNRLVLWSLWSRL